MLSLALLASVHRLSLTVVCIDHGLRRSAADEAAAVVQVAQRLGLSGQVCRVVVPDGASRQAQARHARYSALSQLASAHSARFIAVGHTRDDQAETMLMRWLAGAGPAGLCGMSAVAPVPLPTAASPNSAAPASPSAVLLRPLLAVSRAQVSAFLARAGDAIAPLPHTDPSNGDPRYLRSRLRSEVLPLLRQLAPNLDDHLLTLSDQLRHDTECLDALAQQALQRVRWSDPADPESCVLSVRALLKLPRAVAARVLRLACGDGLGARHVDALLAVCQTTGGIAWLDLPGCGRVERRFDLLRLPPRHAPGRPTAPTEKVDPGLDGCQSDG